MAELLYEQYEKHEANPAQIMNHFTDEEEHREVAGLFHTKIKELTTVKEQEKALLCIVRDIDRGASDRVS